MNQTVLNALRNKGRPILIVEGNKTTFLSFGEKSSTVIKRHKRGAPADYTKERLALLREIWRVPALRRTIPHLVNIEKSGAETFVTESFLSGPRMRPSRKEALRHFDLVRQWLDYFVVPPRAAQPRDTEQARRFISSAAKISRLSGEREAHLRRICLEALNRHGLRAAHGDLSHANIVMQKEGIGVLELDEYAYLPLGFDYFNFATNYFHYLATREKSKDVAGSLLSQEVMARSSIPKEDYRALLLLYLADRVAFFEKIKEDAASMLNTLKRALRQLA